MTFTKENWKEMQAKRKIPPGAQPKGGSGRAVQAPPFPLYRAFPMPVWTDAPLEECIKLLNKLHEHYEEGKRIVGLRQSLLPKRQYFCIMCGVEVGDGQWKFFDAGHKNPETGQLEPAIICRTPSTNCFEKYQQERQALRRKEIEK